MVSIKLILLSCVNFCFMGIIFSFVFLSGILTQNIVPDESWSTIPITIYVVAAAVSIIPISILMEKHGRQLGFMVGAICGCLSGLAICVASYLNSFTAMCLAGFCIGGLTASAGFLRFAGLELSIPEQRGKAASIVLCGGIIAAFFGTKFPLLIEDLIKIKLFDALSINILILSIISVSIIFFLPRMQIESMQSEKHSRLIIIDLTLFRQVQFTRGVAACAGGYMAMTLLMNAAPLYITDILGLSVEVAEKVMRNHFAAMFMPFLFSGFLLDRLGDRYLAISGIALNALSITIFLSGSSEIHLHLALITLGIGWNFLFLSGTTILQSSLPENKLHVGQRMNELVVDGGNAVCAAIAGAFIFTVGLPLLLVIASIVCGFILVIFLKGWN